MTRDSLAGLVMAFRVSLGVDDAAVGTQLALRGALELEAREPGGRVLWRGLRYAEDAAHALAALVLPEELAARIPEGSELVIVPRGPLALVPFAALPLGRAGERFGNTYAIRYAPSLASQREAEARSGISGGTAALQSAVVVRNPEMPMATAYSGGRLQLSALPAAEDEARWVAARLGATLVPPGEATEGAVRQQLPEAPLVHLATHG